MSGKSKEEVVINGIGRLQLILVKQPVLHEEHKNQCHTNSNDDLHNMQGRYSI